MPVHQLRRLDTSGCTEDFELTKARYGFGASWDAPPGRPKVDVDLQCVVIDNAGAIIDCAYYNNMKAVRAITHSGDESTGEKGGIDEMVWANLKKLPANVALLVFVVAAYSGGKLKDVVNGCLHVMEESDRNEVARFDMERSEGSVDVVAAMFKGSSGNWALRIIDEPAQQGQHFMDILPLISEVVRCFIPNAPKKQKVAFAMEKGSVLDLPQQMDSITIGLGWDTDDGEVDLDVSAVLLNAAGGEVETVFFGQLESARHGIKHSGDNLTGAGDGDDEQIQVKLNSVGAEVQQVIFVINIYTQRKTFLQVANPYCRVEDNASASELCRYSLRDAGRESGLIVSKINREEGNRWGFHALGLPCRGRTYKDAMPEILRVCQEKTHKLMQRGGTLDLSSSGYANTLSMPPPASAPPASAPPPGAKKDCVVQ
jgi:tellurium resistance protein TerZ